MVGMEFTALPDGTPKVTYSSVTDHEFLASFLKTVRLWGPEACCKPSPCAHYHARLIVASYILHVYIKHVGIPWASKQPKSLI